MALFVRTVSVFFGLCLVYQSSAAPTHSTTASPIGSPPSDEDECVLKITINALQQYEAGTTSCNTLEENLNEAKGCPYGTETKGLVDTLDNELNAWCVADGNGTYTLKEKSSNNNSSVIGTPNEELVLLYLFPQYHPAFREQCLLEITINLLKDEDTNGIRSCATLRGTLEQVKQCPVGRGRIALEKQLTEIVHEFCDKNKLSLDK